ncbi:MAG: hypothetical protein Q9221_001517 [Calogaya cf. arnoldii]
MSDIEDPSWRLERLLGQPAEHFEQIHIILQWLAFGNDPILQSRSEHDQHLLTLDQLAEVSIVSLNSLSPDPNRYIPPTELKELLYKVAELEEVPRNRWINDDQLVTVVRFEEGVKEELLSDRFRQGAASRFAFDEAQAKETIAVTCLILLTTTYAPPEGATRVEKADKYPLAHLAALYWIDFVDIEVHSSILWGLIRKLFLSSPPLFKRWTEFLAQARDAYLNSKHSELVSAISHYSDKKTGEHAPPIVWAAAFNLKFIVKDLLTQGVNINEAGGGRAVSALYMAVHEKHYDMASLLLNAGGDVADQYREPAGKYEYGWAVSPLYLACHKGYSREWMDLLLPDKSKLGRPGLRLEVGMESAAKFARFDCIKALIHAGADPNKGTGHEESYGCPLQAVCDHGNEEVVRFLLENGADPNTTGGNSWLGHDHTPLHMAAYRGDIAIVKLLLQRGADPNIQGGDLGNALMAAIFNAHRGRSSDGNLALVEMLLQSGARAEEEWNILPKIQDLNFTYSSERKIPLNERFDPPLAEWIKSKTYDETDLSPGSETSLRKQIEKKWECIHEGQRQRKFGYSCGCMNQKAFDARFKICIKIRKAAARISTRLHEAGISISPSPSPHHPPPIASTLSKQQ